MAVDFDRISSRTILFAASAGGLAVLGLAIGLSLSFWPTDWQPAQQATLAGGLLTFVASIIGLAWKSTFDELAALASHRRDLRGKLLERFMANRSAYYSQLIAVAGELASILAALAKRAEEKYLLEFAFYYTARYIELVAVLRSRFQRLAPSDYPPGLILRSGEAENRVWALMLEPWVFGFWTPREQSSLLTSIRSHDGKLASPQDFIDASSRDRDLQTAWNNFTAAMGTPSRPRVTAQVLYLLNAVLDYEVGRVIDPWYGRPAPYPHKQVEKAHEVLTDADIEPSELGIELPPMRRRVRLRNDYGML